MHTPLTRDDLKNALDTQTAVIQRDLNDRFEHYEQRAIARETATHREMMQGFAEVIEQVNEHTTAELTTLHRTLNVRQEFDHLTTYLAQRFNMPGEELTGVR